MLYVKQCFTQSGTSSRSIQTNMNQEKTLLCRNNDRDALSWILIGHDQDQLCCKQLGETAHEAIAPARLTLYLEELLASPDHDPVTVILIVTDQNPR